jgi:hypothetical protein
MGSSLTASINAISKHLSLPSPLNLSFNKFSQLTSCKTRQAFKQLIPSAYKFIKLVPVSYVFISVSGFWRFLPKFLNLKDEIIKIFQSPFHILGSAPEDKELQALKTGKGRTQAYDSD